MLIKTEITSLYDSHVHWLLTGEKQSYLDLSQVKSFIDNSDEIELNFQKVILKGSWIIGFGWEQFQFKSKKPNKKIIDNYLANLNSNTKIDLENSPVCFIKKDAHSCVLNSVAFELFIDFYKNNNEVLKDVELDENNEFTGVLKENSYYAIYGLIPAPNSEFIEKNLLLAQEYFWSNGFTHIRDMTCSQAQFEVLKKLYSNQQLKIYSELNFHCDTKSQFYNQTFPAIIQNKKFKNSKVDIKGIKIFYDGSLGSDTAMISENNRKSLWEYNDLKEIMATTWENGFEFSVHTLGDRAVDDVVNLARVLNKEKITGILNLEHVQIILPETIQKMKSLHINCHMQPCHWLNDKNWLQQKISSNLLKRVFSWESIRKAKIPLFFGSDAPIEEASLFLNLKALNDSAASGVPRLEADPIQFHTHPIDKSGFTKIENNQVVSVGYKNFQN